MGGVLWGCLSALSLGSADFMARFGTRALGARSVYLFVLAVGASVLSVVVLASGIPLVWSPLGLASSALHGVSVVVMSVLLYTALARGPISMVAPIVAAHPVLVLAFAVATGARPALGQWLAMSAIVAGVVAVARGARPESAEGDAGPRESSTATPPGKKSRRWIPDSAGMTENEVGDACRHPCESVHSGGPPRARKGNRGRRAETSSTPVIPARAGIHPRAMSYGDLRTGENPRKTVGYGKLHASEDRVARRTTLAIAAGASVAYALIIISGQAAVPYLGELQTTWVGRLVGLAALLALFAVRRERPRCERSWLPFLVLLGLLDTGGYLALFAGSTGSHPEATAVAASTFGVVTVVLARIVLREPVTWRQWGAIALVFGGVAALAGADA